MTPDELQSVSVPDARDMRYGFAAVLLAIPASNM
jgi:hypothetical protein